MVALSALPRGLEELDLDFNLVASVRTSSFAPAEAFSARMASAGMATFAPDVTTIAQTALVSLCAEVLLVLQKASNARRIKCLSGMARQKLDNGWSQRGGQGLLLSFDWAKAFDIILSGCPLSLFHFSMVMIVLMHKAHSSLQARSVQLDKSLLPTICLMQMTRCSLKPALAWQRRTCKPCAKLVATTARFAARLKEAGIDSCLLRRGHFKRKGHANTGVVARANITSEKKLRIPDACVIRKLLYCLYTVWPNASAAHLAFASADFPGVISSLPAIPCAPAPDAMERLAGAKAEPSPEGPATDYRAECPKRVSDLSRGSNIPATDAASAAPEENGRPNSSSSVSQVNAARVEPSPPAPQVQTGIVVLKLTFGNGARLRSSWRCSLGRAQVEPLTGESHEVGSSEWQVDLLIGLQMPGEHSEVPLAEFYGRRSLDLRIDESKYLVDHPLVTRLQEALLPSLPKAIVFLDALLAMPLATPGGGPVPFRLRILEDMLDQ
ncbi:unnamed protein product, partial [Polarella glacialis]